jgi:NADPH:quinone reductase-like Zn-dependent oxidoreductase
MRAVTIESPGTEPTVRDDLPEPTPADNEVLVRVQASSVNPVDHSIAPVPDGLDLATAGAAPLAGVTALTLVDALGLSEGDVLLIAGATGGVGSLATQLAVRAGAHVIAPALTEDETYLRDLGVSHVIPRDRDVAAAVRELHPEGPHRRARTSSASEPCSPMAPSASPYRPLTRSRTPRPRSPR